MVGNASFSQDRLKINLLRSKNNKKILIRGLNEVCQNFFFQVLLMHSNVVGNKILKIFQTAKNFADSRKSSRIRGKFRGFAENFAN